MGGVPVHFLNFLNFLKELGEPIRRRYKEHEDRPACFEELGKSVQQISKMISLYENEDEKYSHLEKAEVEKAEKCVEEKRRWYDEKASVCSSLKLYENPTVFCIQIRNEKEVLFY